MSSAGSAPLRAHLAFTGREWPPFSREAIQRRPHLSLTMDAGKRALESPPQPAAKRRINPIPAAPTTGAHAASEPAPARASESHVVNNAARTGGGKSGTAPHGGGESDRSEDEDEAEESRQARLHNLSEEEVEELIWGEEGLLAARDEADRCAAMLEGGASDRLPGEVRQRTACLPFGVRLPSPCPAASRAGGLSRQGAAGAPGGGGRFHA